MSSNLLRISRRKMRWHKIAPQILLILSIFNFVLAAPVTIREINEVRINAVDVANLKVGMAASEKRLDPRGQLSMASSPSDDSPSHPGPAGNPFPSYSVSTDDSLPQTDYSPPSDWVSTDNPSSSYSVSTDYSPPSYLAQTDDLSSPSYSVSADYAPSSTDYSPESPPSYYSASTDYSPPSYWASADSPSSSYSESVSTDYSPSQWASTDNLSPSYSVLTDDPPSPQSVPTNDPPPPQSVPTNDPPPPQSVSTNDPPPPQSVPTDDPPPSQSVSATNDQSPPSAEPHHPVAPESDFFGKFMKGRFKRRISGYGPGDMVQTELQGTVGPSAYVSTPSLPLLPTSKPPG
jgi:hypothetical protein